MNCFDLNEIKSSQLEQNMNEPLDLHLFRYNKLAIFTSKATTMLKHHPHRLNSPNLTPGSSDANVIQQRKKEVKLNLKFFIYNSLHPLAFTSPGI